MTFSGSSHESSVTAVVTSCGRHDLLTATLDSFLSKNTFPLQSILVVEDGPPIAATVRAPFAGRNIEWLSTGQRKGQIAAVDLAYSRVQTPYIFHLEDDWLFQRPGFIESSMAVLSVNQGCLQVYLRAHGDTNGHPVETTVYEARGIRWQKMSIVYDYDGINWHGFSFNPGLRRLSDYQLISSYGEHVVYDFTVPWKAECGLSRLYYSLGYFAAILSDGRENGYVRHLGRGRRVPPPLDRSLYLEMETHDSDVPQDRHHHPDTMVDSCRGFPSTP